MNMDDMTFELTPWESFVEDLYDSSISAAQLLTFFEGEDDDALEEAFQDLEEASVAIDLSDLPRAGASGEAARRLREEEQLSRKGDLLSGLEENDPLRLYLQELAAIPVQGDLQLLSEQLAKNVAKGNSDELLRTRIVNLCLSRVVELAREYTGYGVLLLDLIQEGSLGLWQGTVGFVGGNFEDCRDWWIRQYMAQAILRQARASGLGQKMRQAVEDYRMVDERLLSELGRNPTLDEIAESMHMTVSEIEAVRKFLENARMVGKAHAVKEPDEESPEDTQAVEDTAYYQTRERVDTLLSGISELEHRVVTMRYGLDGKAPQTAAEVGRRLNLTVSEVVELETAALTKMRQSGE
ncbi:MAG: sigma-70 family RNA polymerase sigma factor [Ruminococcaceae bacterium]|nr:sigma-70 family RNA polymerase sigma factor [Oscillospiraceae bacterium]